MNKERRKRIEAAKQNLDKLREEIKDIRQQAEAKYNLMTDPLRKVSALGEALREEMDDLTAAWIKLGDAISYLTVLAGEPEAEEQEPEKEAEEKPADAPKKRLRIRVEDADDNGAEEFQADGMLLYLADEESDGVGVKTVRNLTGYLCPMALAKVVSGEESYILNDMLSFWKKKEGGAR